MAKVLVDKDNYLLELCRYVVFGGVATNAVLLQFGNQRSQAVERFQAFISQGIGQDIWHDLKHQIYLGNENFVEKHMKHLTDYEGKLSEIPQKQRRKPAKSLKEFQEINTNRNDAIVAAYQSGAYTMAQIANYFGCYYSTVSRIIAKCKT